MGRHPTPRRRRRAKKASISSVMFPDNVPFYTIARRRVVLPDYGDEGSRGCLRAAYSGVQPTACPAPDGAFYL